MWKMSKAHKFHFASYSRSVSEEQSHLTKGKALVTVKLKVQKYVRGVYEHAGTY